MTAETIVGQADATPFLTQHEVNSRSGMPTMEEAAKDAALVVNPQASVAALVAAAQARASNLQLHLEAWLDVDGQCGKLAEALEPLAAEVDTLLEALRVKLARKGATHG